jgi:hypothetical protein
MTDRDVLQYFILQQFVAPIFPRYARTGPSSIIPLLPSSFFHLKYCCVTCRLQPVTCILFPSISPPIGLKLLFIKYIMYGKKKPLKR